MNLILFIASILVVSSSARQPPAKITPATFWSWMITSAFKGNATIPAFLKGQNVVFDSVNGYACRYKEEYLVNNTGSLGADYCDYNKGMHYYVQNVKRPNAPCTSQTPIGNQIPFVTFPAEFYAKARYMNATYVNGRWCDQWVALPVQYEGQKIQIDLFATNDTLQYPCQISIRDMDTDMGVTWAFTAFNETIPAEAKLCTTARVLCAQRDWICRTKRDAEFNQIGRGLSLACNPRFLDCDSLNPGGPNNRGGVLEHADWAFNAYFKKFGWQQGEGACDFQGVAELIPPPKSSGQDLKRNLKKDPINWLSYDFICAHTTD